MGSEIEIVKLQWYNGNIKDTTPRGLITLEQFISSHKNPSKNILKAFDEIEQASMDGDKELKAKLKTTKLFYFTPSAIFSKGRKYTNITEFTGLAQIDVDGLEPEEAIDLKNYLFDNYNEIYCSYLSPSRRGVKALIRIPIVKSVSEFKEYYQGIENELNWISGFDSAPKNLALPLFISWDTDILYRENANVWNNKGELQKENLPNLNSKPPSFPIIEGDENVFKSQAYFKKTTIDIFTKKIDLINDNGHPQLRSACLVLGSRVGAGYLTSGEALSLAESLIRSNHYLSKGISGYISTANWSIRKSMNNPKYYD
tara:strand:- start:940 stop:1881 length:942 start_codon:yes stop_codon:yes gene_type:complete